MSIRTLVEISSIVKGRPECPCTEMRQAPPGDSRVLSVFIVPRHDRGSRHAEVCAVGPEQRNTRTIE